MEKKKIRLIKLIYPQRCRYCDRVIDIREDVCDGCSETIRRIEGDACSLCGRSKNDCDCGNKKHFYKGIYAPFYYEGAIKEGLWNYKFQKKRRLSKMFAKDMAQCFYLRYSDYDFDLCTFVPSAKEDMKERGFNHAELLARDFCEIVGIECEELLVKNFTTHAQHSLNSVERTGNLLGAIDIKEGVNIDNKRILLCDDIKTTGATLNECAKNLLIAGAAEVFCLTVAVTDKRKNEKNTEGTDF